MALSQTDVVEQHNAFKSLALERRMDNYAQLLERIAHASSLSVDEIGRKVEAKRAKLSGLVSKEGAAQIVAAELGINFEQEKMRIAELVTGMKRAHVLGKVIELFPVRAYSKQGKEGKVANLILADQSSNVRTVLWDTNHIALIEQGKIKIGDVLDITNASVRNGELHLSSFADIKHTSEKLEGVVTAKQFAEGKLKEAKPGQRLKIRAFIVQAFEPRYFEVCPECGKRANDNQCAVHGSVTGAKRVLATLVLDDGSESIRAVLFMEQLRALGFSDEELFSLEQFAGKKEALLGEERYFAGSIRTNALYNTTEFMIESIEQVQPEALVKQLQAY